MIVGIAVLMFGLFALVAALALAQLGVMGAPITGLISGLIARKKGLSFWRYAGFGAVYSALFLFPWFYLLLRQLSMTPPRFLIRAAYVVLYGVIWPSTTIMSCTVQASPDTSAPASTLLSAIMLVSMLGWIVSLAVLGLWPSSQSSAASKPGQDVLPPFRYLMPFVYAFLLITILAAVILFEGSELGLSGM